MKGTRKPLPCRGTPGAWPTSPSAWNAPTKGLRKRSHRSRPNWTRTTRQAPIHGVELMANFEQVIASPIAAYEEGLAFFRGQGMLNNTLLRIVADLERNGIAYAVIG